MDNNMFEMQKGSERVQRIKSLQRSAVKRLTLDLILINIKSLISVGITCVAMLYLFDTYQWDRSYLIPMGFLIGFSKYFFYTLPEQRAARTLAALHLFQQMEQENLLQKDVD